MTEKKDKWLERGFQVFLVLLGFVIGLFGTQYANYHKEKSQKKEAAKVLKVLLQAESRKNKKMIKAFEAFIIDETPKFLAPEGLKWHHSLTLHYNLNDKIKVLESEIIAKYIGYIRMSEQCGAFRDLVLIRLNPVGQSHQVNLATIETYLIAVKGVEKSAEELSDLINKYYGI